MAQKNPKIYQIKVTLEGAKPPIWRRLKISSATDLAELHDIIQISMGWTDSHLHLFFAGRKYYGIPDPEFPDDTIPEKGIQIDSLLKREKDSLDYVYDFGDGWDHKITLEKILPITPGETVPRCITGRRGCPPEDIGGIWGYEEFLKAYTDKSHPEHEEFVEWAGECFDPERFDRLEVNEILSER